MFRNGSYSPPVRSSGRQTPAQAYYNSSDITDTAGMANEWVWFIEG